MDSLKATEAASAAVAIAPRVKLEDIENAIAARFDLNSSHLFTALGAWSTDEGRDGSPPASNVVDSLKCFSICILVMTNGFTVIGKSAPASPENYNPDLGKQYAYENAVRELWPLMGYALRDRLAERAKVAEITGCPGPEVWPALG